MLLRVPYVRREASYSSVEYSSLGLQLADNCVGNHFMQANKLWIVLFRLEMPFKINPATKPTTVPLQNVRPKKCIYSFVY